MDQSSSNNQPSGKPWVSLEQWRQDPEFIAMAEQEFTSSPLKSEDGTSGTARRDFLKLMGASLALTSFGCVRRPAQKIIPYAKKPPEIVHGHPLYYASSFTDGMETLGILVTTRDGRPIKIAGNPDHPTSQGAMSARAYADILKLYDPDRFTAPKRNMQNKNRTNRETINAKWEDLDQAVVEQLRKGKVAVLTANHASPTTAELMGEFASAFGAKVYQYDDVGYDSLLEAERISYGSAALPRLSLDRAKLVVAINNDFMGTWFAPVTHQRQFGMARKKTAEMNKLIVFESLMSMTGSNADKRFRIRPSQSLDVVMALIHEIVVVGKNSRYASDENVGRVISAFGKNREELGINVAEVAKELWANRGKSVVLAGGTSADGEFAVPLQVAVNFLNSVLENDGKTISGGRNVVRGESIAALINALNKKEISTLIIHGSNPVYSLPPGAKFTEALKNVTMLVTTSDRNDETARLADYVATDHHSLENWGDMQSLDGVVSIQQPTISPLHDTRSFQDSMLAWLKVAEKGSAKAKNSATWYDYLRTSWQSIASGRMGGKSFDDFWTEILQTGVLPGAAAAGTSRSLASGTLANVKPVAKRAGFELALYQKVAIGDGRMANVPWLQEVPDPVTKICWDNYACFSPKDAVQLKIKEGAHVTITVNGAKVEVPAHIQPGQADGVVGLALGYGRNGGGKVVDGIGANAMTLAQWQDGRAITSGLEAEVKVLSKHTELAVTQGHHVMEGRQIVVEETLEDYLKKPGGQVHRHKMSTMWSEHKYTGNRWAMTIDLSQCTGCSACIVACQSENNIPVVGKRYVIQGREMHWIRIDRYYVGNPEDPDVVHQPIMCMHCENAPCETVCPVIATVHSDEGTNDMIYNRCVGTRYCANNCPYKVRRFNWFSYTDIQAPRQMALNPEVTVRSRGVMEKCSFCIHRIRSTKQLAKVEDRKLKDGDIKTACQEGCPNDCIVFGDLNDPNSQIAKNFNQPDTYSLLEELNIKPMIKFKTKVRNTDALKYVPKHVAAHGAGHKDGHGAGHGHTETEKQTPGHAAPETKDTKHPTEAPAEGGH